MTRINTNVQSLIARHALAINNVSLTDSLKRLSTGLRINSGRDDPAGLIASETLRSTMRGISAAVGNAERADTIVAIAEGGLQEIANLLLEVESLVDRSANEAGLTSQEVDANQMQIDAILNSINRIADSVAFGDKKLLDGTLAFTTSGVNINEATGAAQSHFDTVSINSAKIAEGSFRSVVVNLVNSSEVAHISAVLGGTTGTGSNPLSGALGDSTTIQVRGNLGSEILSFASAATAAQIVTAVNASTAVTGVKASAYTPIGGGAASVSFSSSGYGTDAFVAVKIIENQSTAFATNGLETERDEGVDGTVTINGTNAIVKGLKASMRTGSLSLDLTMKASFGGGGQMITTSQFEITGGGAIFSISEKISLAGKEAIGITSLTSATLGNVTDGFLATLNSGGTNDLSKKNFTTSQKIVREAISQVATLRGRLGSFQKDTLGSTINSLNIALENITAAESVIRDADFALVTSNLTRAQILVNSTTVALQLANAQPQSILALLG